MKKKRTLISVIVGLMLALMLVGCGAPKTLEAYCNIGNTKAQMDAAAKSMADGTNITDVKIDIKDNTITYKFTLSANTAEAWATYSSAYNTYFDTQMESLINQLKSSTKISDPMTINMQILDPNGKEVKLYTKTK